MVSTSFGGGTGLVDHPPSRPWASVIRSMFKNLITITLAVGFALGLFPVSTWAQNATTQSSDEGFLSDWFHRITGTVGGIA